MKLKKTGLGAYEEGIIPYVVADLKEDGLIESHNDDEISITKKGINQAEGDFIYGTF